ncbi:hypothetical protein FHY05_004328 [Sphingomonas sp. BK580]|nr:hypothetical protein [Sphingomonas sp. BK580]
MDHPDFQRRTQPLVPVQADEVAVEVGQGEVELLPAVRGVDDHVHAARPGDGGDLAHR